MKIPIVFVVCLFVGEGFAFIATGLANVTRSKRQTECGKYEFLCKSGECINEDIVCDGKGDCKDNSDETTACKSNVCPSFLFKCAYGACISSTHTCDGRKDCVDNSDEAPSLCAKTGGIKPTENKCAKDQFTCVDGKCIDEEVLCDGVADCSDGSDETVDICSNILCPNYSFKCAYGACINADLKCNGVKNCNDNSDEDGCPGRNVTTVAPPVVTPVTPVTVTSRNPGTGCNLPEHPKNGKWMTIVGNPSNFKPGDVVSSGTPIQFACNPEYDIVGTKYALCEPGNKWSVVPQCVRMCIPFPTGNHAVVECKLNDTKIPCDRPFEGTTAFVKCEALYQDPYLKSKPFNYCRDGSWNYAFPNCEPDCGLRIATAETLIIDGKEAEKGEFPWHVGIYYEYENICGGSIITPKIILTAAHCVKFNVAENFQVAAGKFYSKYNDPRDKHAQFSNVSKIIIHPRYHNGVPYYAYDIAMFVLITPFAITAYALPVCIEQPHFSQAELLNKAGIVVGWGYTEESGKPSETLKYLEADYKNEASCQLASSMLYYYTYAPDKLCAGKSNAGMSACKGDSGGGLVFEKDKKYYIHGIVSLSAGRGKVKDAVCDSNTFTLYTYVDFHIETIEEVKSQNKL